MKKEKRGRRSPCESRSKESFGFQRVEAGRKTSAVHVYIGYTMIGALRELVARSGRLRCESRSAIWWDLVKRCDQPVQKFQVQLESLILAQSERWRQA